jgi:hypothetical protein
MTAGTFIRMNHAIDLMVVLHVFGVTMLAYNVQRIIGLQELSNRTDQVRWYLDNSKLLLVAIVIGALCASISIGFIEFKTLLYGLPLAALSFLYTLPFMGAGGKRALRDLPGIKLFIIAIVWTGVTVGFPLLEADIEMNDNALLLLVQRMLFILAITIPFDVRDMDLDDSGLKTLPQAFGARQAKLLAIMLILAAGGLEFFYQVFDTGYPLDASFYLNLIFYPLLIPLVWRVNRNSPDVYCTGILDGCMLLLGLILLID